MRRILLLSSCVVAVAACKPVWDPTFMPSGYAYHGNKYNSPSGKANTSIGYEYSAEKHASVMKAWRVAIRDLVLRAEAHGIRPDRPVSLHTDLEPSAFQGTFAYTLGQELIDAGYSVSEHPGEDTMLLFYSAYDPEYGEDVPYQDLYNDDIAHYNEDNRFSPEEKTLELVLGTPVGDELSARVSNVYDIPLHGFTPAGYDKPYARPKTTVPGEREPLDFAESPDDGLND